MDRIRCQFCHKYIDRTAYPAHRERHLRLQPDGQHTDYTTLPPEERDHGSLAGVPQVYVHQRCGAATRMPEEIIRSYLRDPDLYSADETFCTGCGYHVPFQGCVWTETGEDLQTYMDRLRAEKREMRQGGRAVRRDRGKRMRTKRSGSRPGLLQRIITGLAELFG